jgi:hypothetical protein
LFANAEIRALASAEGAVAILNTGNALYAMPLFSIIDLGVNLKIDLAEELSRKIEPPSHEHSLGIDLDERLHKIAKEQRSRWIDMDERSRGIVKEERSRGIDIEME